VTRRVPDDPRGWADALETLRSGGLVALPTDTVYGLAVDLRTPGGIDQLFAAKGRPAEKAIVVLVDGLDQLAGLVVVPKAAQVLAGAGWPGALTLVLPLRTRDGLPGALTAGTATLGVRVPDHPTPRALARTLGPLPTTSANRSGEPDALDADDVMATVGPACDLILDGGRTRGGVPSTVIDCTNGPPFVRRVGALPVEPLAAALDAAGLPHALREPVPTE
jgi:L-threonylcarbamoyladenylate synthase